MPKSGYMTWKNKSRSREMMSM